MSAISDGDNKRRYKRIELSVPARFLCVGGSEQAGQLLDVSAGGLAIQTEARPSIGTHAVVYVDDLGRMQGRVARHLENGFAVEFEASTAKRERLAARLTWFANNQAAPMPEEDIRLTPALKTEPPKFVLGDGRAIECKVLDMSVNGVWLQVAMRPPVGEEITIGRMKGRVTRHHQTGIAIEFMR